MFLKIIISESFPKKPIRRYYRGVSLFLTLITLVPVFALFLFRGTKIGVLIFGGSMFFALCVSLYLIWFKHILLTPPPNKTRVQWYRERPEDFPERLHGRGI